MPINDHRTAKATRLARRRPARRIAAGLLSATAAAGLVTGVSTAASPALASAAQAGAGAGADAGMPRYYVLGSESGAGALQVRSSATGKVISSVAAPAACDAKTFQIATADDRSFVVGCDTPQSKSRSIAFYRLQVTSRGRAFGLRPLAIRTPDDALDAVALTPDGRRLAIAMQGFGGVPGGAGAVEVVTLATGVTRTWTGSSPYDLTWTDNGRALGLFENSGLYTFNVGAAGSTLKSAHLVLSRTFRSDGVAEAKLSPDGRTIIASVTYDLGNQPLHRGTVVGGIIEISARTKKQLGTLLPIHAQYSADGGGSEAGWYETSCLLGPVDPTGHHLLASCDRFGRLDRGRFTALPGVPPVTYFSAAW
ncbi:MAG TPA: hypothetical protein VH089_17695 [Streptosporangiaceae bacterium]|nr:hypothetical protein [Streptosporangiaceae bacterium]